MDSTLGLRFQRDGFVHVPGVFSADEVSALRRAVLAEAERAKRLGQRQPTATGEIVPSRDVPSMPGLEDLVFDDRLVGLARQLLDTPKPVYFGDSGIMVGGSQRGFHKDNTNRDDATHADWQSTYGLLRMGLYLQDHSEHSGGLRLRVGSHLHADVTTGRSYAVPTKPGDVVIWNLRTTHSGHAVRIKGAPGAALQPRVEFRLPQQLRIGEAELRAAIFVTYGKRGLHLDNYLHKHTDQSTYPDNYLLRTWEHSDGRAAVSERATRAGVEIVKAIPNYGEHFGDTEYPAGFVVNGKSRPDVYPAQGLEAAIQLAGRVWRTVRRS